MISIQVLCHVVDLTHGFVTSWENVLFTLENIGTLLKLLGIISLASFYTTVLSKFVGPVGQSDIFYECPTKNVRVPDQMSDKKIKISIWWMKRSETQVNS